MARSQLPTAGRNSDGEKTERVTTQQAPLPQRREEWPLLLCLGEDPPHRRCPAQQGDSFEAIRGEGEHPDYCVHVTLAREMADEHHDHHGIPLP
jgi:hypothetical protein